MLRDQDFNDDKKDAGDIGAGHTVTALYEIVPAGRPVPGASVDALTYQRPAGAAASGDLMTVKIRYKAPQGSTSKLLSRSVGTATVALAQAKLVEFSPQNDGPVATIELVFKGFNSSPIIQTDAVVVTFN